jgi:hypothetical protein
MANRKGIILRQLEDRVLVITKLAELTSEHLGKLEARVCGMSDGVHAGALSHANRIEAVEKEIVNLRNEILADMHRVNGLEKHSVGLATSNRDLALEVLRLDGIMRLVKTETMNKPMTTDEDIELITVKLTREKWQRVMSWLPAAGEVHRDISKQVG